MTDSRLTADLNRNMALTFYTADIVKVFAKVEDEAIKNLAEEIGALSLVIPIYFRPEEYKDGEVQKALDIARKDILDYQRKWMLSASFDNHMTSECEGKTIKERVTLLYLVGLYAYCVDRLSNGGIEDKEGFEYLKMGKLLAREKQ
jgi:hypothetical protein